MYVKGELLFALVTDTEAPPLPDPQVSEMEVVDSVTGLIVAVMVNERVEEQELASVTVTL